MFILACFIGNGFFILHSLPRQNTYTLLFYRSFPITGIIADMAKNFFRHVCYIMSSF